MLNRKELGFPKRGEQVYCLASDLLRASNKRANCSASFLHHQIFPDKIIRGVYTKFKIGGPVTCLN